MIADLERAIVERLAEATSVEVAAFPDSPDAYRVLHQRGAILVGYRGMEAVQPPRLSRLTQVARARWQVTVLARSLRRHDGAYELLEMVRSRLLGWSPGPSAGPLWLVSEEYRTYEDGTWQYDVTWACHVVVGDQEVADQLLATVATGVNIDQAQTVLHVDQL